MVITENRRNQGGFTMVELLVALMVSSVILAAVASICQAMGTGQEVCLQMGTHQTKIRYTSVRIPELVRHSLYVWLCDNGSAAIWAGDANGNHQIEGDELVYLMQSADGTKIQLLEAPGYTSAFTEEEVGNEDARNAMGVYASKKLSALVDGCSNIQFQVRNNKLLIVQFELSEESGSRDYEIVAARMGSAEPWLSGGVFVSDDD